VGKMSSKQAFYFILLAIITVAAFIILFPLQLGEYQGHTIGKMGLIGGLMIFLGGFAVLLLNIISSIVFFIRRKHRFISLVILSVSGLALFWPAVAGAILPYETLALHRARQVINADDFRNLKKLYPGRFHSVPVSVLPQAEYFMVGDYVINFKRKTYGRLKVGLGFFADYYDSGDRLSFTDLESLIKSLPYDVHAKDVIAIYELMQRMHLSDASVDRKTHSTVFAWEQSSAAGTRGIIVNDAIDPTLLRSKMEIEAKFEKWEILSPGLYYFRISPRY
jgi:hypothetical protein